MYIYIYIYIYRWIESCFVSFTKFNLSPNPIYHFNSWIRPTYLEINIISVWGGAEWSGLDDLGELGGLLHKPNFESRTLAAIPEDAFLIFHGGRFFQILFHSSMPSWLNPDCWALLYVDNSEVSLFLSNPNGVY